MKTLYLRNVPDELVEELQNLAERSGISVNALAVQELTDAARRVKNRELLHGFAVVRMNWADLVEGIEDDRR
jgi:ABC-type uncharacterized transport system substrate-binding protein